MQPDFPSVPMLGLDTLWFQVSGTVCNLACRHCFISCSPTNHAHAMMDLAAVQAYLAQAESLGVREYYFTGGEPFLNPEIIGILRAALLQGPCSVLTNGTLITAKRSQDLKALGDGSPYSLEIRLSLDGLNREDNDAVRGEGSFDRILEAIRHLAEAGINPVITITEACDDAGSAEGRARALDYLRSIGLNRPRLKVMPILHLGAEEIALVEFRLGQRFPEFFGRGADVGHVNESVAHRSSLSRRFFKSLSAVSRLRSNLPIQRSAISLMGTGLR